MRDLEKLQQGGFSVKLSATRRFFVSKWKPSIFFLFCLYLLRTLEDPEKPSETRTWLFHKFFLSLFITVMSLQEKLQEFYLVFLQNLEFTIRHLSISSISIHQFSQELLQLFSKGFLGKLLHNLLQEILLSTEITTGNFPNDFQDFIRIYFHCFFNRFLQWLL